MRASVMRRLGLFVVLCLAQASWAQFEGLNLKRPRRSADAGVDGGSAGAPAAAVPSDAGLRSDAGVITTNTAASNTPAPDMEEGDPVIALPFTTSGGKVDVENSKTLHAALRERLGKRLVTLEATMAAVDQAKAAATLVNADVQKKLGVELKAELMISFEVSGKEVVAKLMARPGALADAVSSIPLPKNRKFTQVMARTLVGELLFKGQSTIAPAPALDLSSAPPPADSSASGSAEDLESPSDVKAVRAVPELKASWLSLFAGAGTSFRSLDAVSQSPVVPRAPATMAALGFNVRVFPLRLVSSMAESKLAEAFVEGQYRLNLVKASVDTATSSTSCPVSDDEVLGRVGYRYALGGMLPHLGVTVGVANERTHFDCAATALDTVYTSTEYHLDLWQPILPQERLALELAGGPRLLFSARAQGFQTFAFSAEGWLVARPVPIFSVRAGARVTGTKLTTWPDGVGVFDLRTFIGLEVGAAL